MKKFYSIGVLVAVLASASLFGAEESRSRKPIFRALKTGDLEGVQSELAQKGLNLDKSVGDTNRSLLRHAIHQLAQAKKIIKALVNAGATVGVAWKRVPEKGVFDIDLIEFLVTHHSADSNTTSDALQLSQVPLEIREVIATIINSAFGSGSARYRERISVVE